MENIDKLDGQNVLIVKIWIDSEVDESVIN